MIKKIYIVPFAELIVQDIETDLLCGSPNHDIETEDTDGDTPNTEEEEYADPNINCSKGTFEFEIENW